MLKIPLQVFDDPTLQVAKRPVVGALFAKRHTKLRLISWPAEKNHQHARNFKGDFLSMVLLDQGEAKIDARSHPRRAVDVAVAYPDRVAVDRDIGKREKNSLTNAQ